MDMTRTTGVMLAALLVLSSAGVAVAADGKASGQAGRGSASSERMRKFQKETLALRDELAAKRVDVDAEYAKDEPDAARIASLREQIGELRVKIQAVADKHGVRSWGRDHGYAMRGSHGQGDWDDGCGCGHCW
jgi:TolA-binding protein